MAEFVKITEVVSAPEQPDPVIRREMVELPERDAEGKLTGKMVLQEKVRGNLKYGTHLVPDGQEAVQTLEVGGVVKGVARWTAESLPGKNAIVQSRLVVGDNCEQDTFTPSGGGL